MLPILIEQLDISKNNRDNFLFLNGDNYITNTACNSRLKRILKYLLKWNETGISTHSLRHTFATRCIESGVNAVVLQRLLGHTDISITLNTYTSVFNQFKDNELEKVMNLYNNNSLGVVPSNYILPENENSHDENQEIELEDEEDELEL